jgi:hypothetical protein
MTPRQKTAALQEFEPAHDSSVSSAGMLGTFK